jgi:hypothetical protein
MLVRRPARETFHGHVDRPADQLGERELALRDCVGAFGFCLMSANDPKRTYVATSLMYQYGCADRYPVIEICDVLVPHPETAG